MKTINKGKSLDILGLSIEHLIYSGEELVDFLLLFVQRILTDSKIPDILKQGVITPVYKKKGNSNDPRNYRGIAVFSDVKQAEIIEAFKSTSRYLDDLLNIDNPYFEGMVNRIYPPELQLNKTNTSDTEAPFLDLHLSISNGFVSSKIYDKRDDFDFDIVIFPFLDGDVPRSTSYGV